jgi:hypothetical protein
MLRGSITMSFIVPFLTELIISIEMIGWASLVFEPMIRVTSACPRSSMEFVIAPLPNVAARPATVGACHNLAQ